MLLSGLRAFVTETWRGSGSGDGNTGCSTAADVTGLLDVAQLQLRQGYRV